MKFSTVLVLVVFAACVKSDKEMMMKVVEACKTTIDASDDDMQKFMTHAIPENHKQKCFFSCVMTGLEVVSWSFIEWKGS